MQPTSQFDLTQLPERFWAKVRVSNGGCWVWTGSKDTKGYGQFWWKSKLQLAHRVSYSVLVDFIPKGLSIDHLCRVTLCVNPDHLEPVTHKENHQRGKQATATHCPKGHLYDEKNTYRRPSDKGNRRCRACDLERERRRRERGRVSYRKLQKES